MKDFDFGFLPLLKNLNNDDNEGSHGQFVDSDIQQPDFNGKKTFISLSL